MSDLSINYATMPMLMLHVVFLVQNITLFFPLFFIAHHINPIVYGPLSIVQTFQTLAEPLLVNIVLMHYVVGEEFLKRFKASYGRIFFSFTTYALAVTQISFESDVPPRTLGVPVEEHCIT